MRAKNVAYFVEYLRSTHRVLGSSTQELAERGPESSPSPSYSEFKASLV